MSRSRPLVLIHGYSDTAQGFRKWVDVLTKRGYDVKDIRISDYKSLTNELTVKDVAEGLDRALRIEKGLDGDQPFDAIVHSTGGLVIRSWLVGRPDRRKRVKNLVMLAPANFGSPMAHKGRSTLGALFKGNQDFGPDFMEAGDKILSNLELGSAFSWDLAQQDLLGPAAYYDAGPDTPYVFVCIGNKDYGFLKRAFTEPGTDGTVRWAGCGLNCRHITVDLTRAVGDAPVTDRIKITPWTNDDMPLLIADGLNHGTIMGDPSEDLIGMVDRALNVDSKEQYEKWCDDSDAMTKAALESATMDQYQQFVIRAVDSHGDPIRDYHLEFFEGSGDDAKELDFAEDAHQFKDDPSFRCFHVNLTANDPAELKSLYVRVIASSGSAFVGYHGFGCHRMSADSAELVFDGKWDGEIELSAVLGKPNVDKSSGKESVNFFHPFTTTLIEIRLNRDPEPLVGRNQVLRLLEA
jgi:pimeloyl-ACP methyl ester carboxylesterase